MQVGDFVRVVANSASPYIWRLGIVTGVDVDHPHYVSYYRVAFMGGGETSLNGTHLEVMSEVRDEDNKNKQGVNG